MAFLDEHGLSTLWAKIKATFALITHAHAATDITSGTLPITRGGTGSTTAAGALTNLGAAAIDHTHTSTAKLWTGTCSTDAGTTQKVVVLDDATGFKVADGTRVMVTFTNTNTLSKPTLVVTDKNGNTVSTASYIYHPDWNSATTVSFVTGNSNSANYGKWGAGETVVFTYSTTKSGWIYSVATAGVNGAYYGSTAYAQRGYTTSAATADNSTSFPVLFKTVGTNSTTVYSNTNVYVKQGTASTDTSDVCLYAPSVAITGTPTNDTDAVTKAYVDDVLDGKADTSHTHAASAITSGTLSAARLPVATASALGGVKVGSGLSISNGVLSATGGGAGASTSDEITMTEDGYHYDSGATLTEALDSVDGVLYCKANEFHTHAATDITSGTLPITRGGTGATTAASARSNLGAASTSHTHAASDITSGTLSAARGGTGYTTLQATRSAMGLGNTTGAVPIANGGTGSTTAANARSALGITCANIGAATSSHTHSYAAAPTSLYTNASGTSASFTLSSSIANFSVIEVFFKTNDYCLGCQKIWNNYASSASFDMSTTHSNTVTENYTKTSYWTVSGTTVSFVRASESCLQNGSTVLSYSLSTAIKITRVVGWKY